MTALRYAVKMESEAGVSVLLEERSGERVGRPVCLLTTHHTGQYQRTVLGIPAVRRLTLARGAREGNNALTEDKAGAEVRCRTWEDKDKIVLVVRRVSILCTTAVCRRASRPCSPRT